MLLLATHAMGTRFELVLQGEDERELRAVGEETIREIEEWHRRLSRFEAGSDVSRLNRDASARVDSEMRELLALCERVRVESGGAFDVRCGEGGTLDFGAVGKGWALDRAADVLREHGVGCALLHGGTSSVVVIGAPECEHTPSGSRVARTTFPTRAGEAGWRVSVRSDAEPMEVVLKDAAMGVSAPRGFRGVDGKPDAVAGQHGLPSQSSGRTRGTHAGADVESHIVDPRTGRAVSRVDTAVVVVRNGARHACALADAWSTALVVMGKRGERMDDGFDSYVHTERGWESHSGQRMGAA
jgi:thiamine biosynthesis lipoprotein ApbE